MRYVAWRLELAESRMRGPRIAVSTNADELPVMQLAFGVEAGSGICYMLHQ
jgi:hypothetical protein